MGKSKIFSYCCATFCLLYMAGVSADTYTVTGGNFTALNGAAYSASMKVTGTITTSGPIPPNSVDFDITPLVTGFSFFDGVQTVNNANGVFYDTSTGDARPQFSTDNMGKITTAKFNVTTAYPAVMNGTFSAIVIDELKSAGYLDGKCEGITNGFCTTPAEAEGYSSGESEEGTSWTHQSLPPPVQPATPIPTLSGMGIILFSMLLGLTVVFRRRNHF